MNYIIYLIYFISFFWNICYYLFIYLLFIHSFYTVQILLAILIDAQPFYITGISTREKHQRVSSNAIQCSIAYGLTALVSYYVSVDPHRITYLFVQGGRRFLFLFLLPFTTQYTPTYFYKRRMRRSYSTLASTSIPTTTTTNSTAPHDLPNNNTTYSRFGWLFPWRIRSQPLIFHHELPLYHNIPSSNTSAPTSTAKITATSTSTAAIPHHTIMAIPSTKNTTTTPRYYQNTGTSNTSFWSNSTFRNIGSSSNSDGKAKKSKKKR